MEESSYIAFINSNKMSNNNNNQSQPVQTPPAPTNTQAAQPAPPPLEFIGVNTSANVEMFKGGSGQPLETK